MRRKPFPGERVRDGGKEQRGISRAERGREQGEGRSTEGAGAELRPGQSHKDSLHCLPSLKMPQSCCTQHRDSVVNTPTVTLVEMAEVNYDRLQANTGIDFEALRQKYKQVSSERKNNPVVNEEAEAEVAAERAKASERERIREENASAMKTLDAYKICRTCQGQGTIKEVYNHFNIEKTCPECDGEAVLFADLAKSLNIS
jgi:hypothetical protein